MLFNYQVIDQAGKAQSGSIDAVNIDIAIQSLQRRGFTVSSVKPADGSGSFFSQHITFLERVKVKDVVLLSRQMATLFEAQVSALRIFRLLSAESKNPALRSVLTEVSDDLQGGSSISKALAKHPKVFSEFYSNMVRAGEESGKLDEVFLYLADYLERTYEVTSKAKSALIYPAFVIITFITVMILMLTMVIPNLQTILEESGQAIPIYTQVVIAVSSFFVNYGILLLVLLIVGGFFLWRFSQTEPGRLAFSQFKISIPFIGELYTKLYLSRIADNMNTMLLSAIPIVKALEITAAVVENSVYRAILEKAVEDVKAGHSLSDALDGHPEIPPIMVQMMRVGEETGNLGNILKTLARFYQREVTNAVTALVDLIEPVMIVLLGLGVGFLLASVLIPIYNVALNA